MALPGVQVLFAFLLIVPFNQGFGDLSPFQEHLYLATLLFAALATALLMAPTAQHRVTFRLQDNHHLVSTANRYAIAGIGCLAIAMTLAIALSPTWCSAAPPPWPARSASRPSLRWSGALRPSCDGAPSRPSARMPPAGSAVPASAALYIGGPPCRELTLGPPLPR